MTIVEKKCAELMKWFISNQTERIPEEVFLGICGEHRHDVLDELRKRNIGYRTTKALLSTKLEDAIYWHSYYSNK
jgi:hypothetical protein